MSCSSMLGWLVCTLCGELSIGGGYWPPEDEELLAYDIAVLSYELGFEVELAPDDCLPAVAAKVAPKCQYQKLGDELVCIIK